MMSEAAGEDDIVGGERIGRRKRFGELDDLGEVLLHADVAVRDMRDALAADHAGGEDAPAVGVLRRDDAVRVDDDRAVERGEILRLGPPGAAVVALQVREPAESGIGIGGEHVAVRVDVDVGMLGLDQEFLQVLQVLSGHQDAGVLTGFPGNVADGRGTVGLGVGFVQQRHGDGGDASAFHDQQGEAFVRGVGLRRGGKRLDDEVVDCVVFVTEGKRVEREGADALQPVHEKFAVAAFLRVFDGKDGRILGLNVGIERAESAFRLVDEGVDAVGVEVGIGERGGHGADDEPAELARDIGAAFERQGDGLQLGDEAVLKIGGLGRFAAAAAGRASFVAESLLALVAEHGSFHLDLSPL